MDYIIKVNKFIVNNQRWDLESVKDCLSSSVRCKINRITISIKDFLDKLI